MLEQQPAK